MKKNKGFLLLLLFFAVLIGPSQVAAHPLGMESFGHRVLVHLFPDHVACDYVLEMPSSVMFSKIMEFKEQKGIKSFDKESSDEFNKEILNQLSKNLKLYINDKRFGWRLDPNFKDKTGEGETNFFEYRLRLITHLPDTRDKTKYNIEIVNDNFKDKNSVYFVGLVADKGIKVDKTNLLSDLGWSSDYTLRKVDAVFDIDLDWDKIVSYGSTGLKVNEDEEDEYSLQNKILGYIYNEEKKDVVIFLALLTAFLLGAIHAFSPGHGKALVGAYLVGTRGSYRHAVLLGLIVTITHTLAVYILGLAFLIFSKTLVPEQLTPYIATASGGIIIILGCFMLYRRSKDLKAHSHHHHHHDELSSNQVTTKSLLALGISGGMVPCPTALVLMLAAISVNRVFWGMTLVGAFSFGLAVVLIVLGLFAIGAASIFSRFKNRGNFWYILPLLSSIAVIIVGIAITVSALIAI